MIDPKFLTFLSLCETRNYTKTAELLYHHSVHNYENVRDLKLILQILIKFFIFIF